MGKIRLLVENREDEGFGWHRQAYSLLRWTHAMPDRVICVSDAVRDVVLARERLDPGRVVVIRNGIDSGAAAAVNRDARKDFGIADHELVVGMVANFNRPVKGVTYFLDAIPAIVRQVPHSRFLILGGGDEHQALRDKARALNIEPYLIFGGYRGDVERCYGAMDVSVLTSLSEGLSITLLESMRHSLPIVATAVGGNPEVVVQGETGYLVPPRDVPAFARRVVQLLRDPARRARMGNSGRLRVARYFDISAVAQRYLDVYADLLEQRAAAA
jgi:glycosyltransferase involved in cell wall biosynthesis